MNCILVTSFTLLSLAIGANCQGLGGRYDPGVAVPAGELNRQFNTISDWYQNIDQRVQEVEKKFQNVQTNDRAHDARRLAALRIINNLKAQLYNRDFYISQQGTAPWYYAKRLENQLNSLGYGYLRGIWKVTRCGQGMYWNNCGQIVEGTGR